MPICHFLLMNITALDPIIWYRPRGTISSAGKVTAGPVESNGSLPPGLWLMSPVGWLTGKKQGSALCPTLVIEYGTIILYILSHAVFKSSQEYWSWSNHRFWYLGWIPELVTTKLTEPLNHCKHEELETWLCHTIQTTLWCFEPFRHGSTVWQTDRIETAIVASNKVKIIGHLFWILSNYNNI